VRQKDIALLAVNGNRRWLFSYPQITNIIIIKIGI